MSTDNNSPNSSASLGPSAPLGSSAPLEPSASLGPSALDAMYQEILLEHSRDPHNFGELEKADLKAEGYNPLCGDKVCIQLQLQGEAHSEKAAQVRFTGQACSICMASASIMTEEVSGCTLDTIQHKIQDFRALMQGEKKPEDFEGDLSSLAGVRRFPVRIKCALLPWTSLNEAIETRSGTHE